MTDPMAESTYSSEASGDAVTIERIRTDLYALIKFHHPVPRVIVGGPFVGDDHIWSYDTPELTLFVMGVGVLSRMQRELFTDLPVSAPLSIMGIPVEYYEEARHRALFDATGKLKALHD